MNAKTYVEHLFTILSKCYALDNPLFVSPFEKINLDGYIPQPLSYEICKALIHHIEYLYIHDRTTYLWYVQIMRREHPLINPIIKEISCILCHARKIKGYVCEFLDILQKFDDRLHTTDVHMKIRNSFYEASRYLEKISDEIYFCTEKVYRDHSLIMFVHHFNHQMIEKIISDCFQDIYVLDYILHNKHIPVMNGTTLILLKNMFQRKNNEIQDPSLWNIILYDKHDNPLLLSHPLLPHPDDFVHNTKGEDWFGNRIDNDILYHCKENMHRTIPENIHKAILSKL